MRILSYLFIGAIVLTTSCNSTKTSLFGKGRKVKEESVKGTSIKTTTLMPATPIKEVEEKLVANEDKAPGPEKYFVIIGSFKDPANAKEHQTLIRKDGFASEVIKNEAGLYRVSVKATDDITAARNEVRRIWAKYPKYSDTWMLIRK
jgi:cell division septation protein DedD